MFIRSLETIFPGLSSAVISRRIDGIFLPFEAGKFEIPQWGEHPAVQYAAPRGNLILRYGAWKNYGFSEQDDFERAVKKGGLFSKTAAGAFSLGMSIDSKNRSYLVSISPNEAFWKTTCFCLNADEAKEVQQLALSIGATKATISNSTLAYIFWIVIPDLLLNISNIPPSFRPFFGILVTNAILAMISLVISFFYHVPAWMPGLFGISFCYFLLVAKKRYAKEPNS